jgi:hypothetical protein
MQGFDSSISVGQSKFGLGVFARRRFRREQAIGKIAGQIIRDPEYGSDFCMDLGDNLTLEPAAPFRYLNHSCQPNCEIIHWQSEEEDAEPEPGLWLHALRAVRPGEELTIDYGWPADTAIPCGCGAKCCRGWIVDPSELDQLPRFVRPEPASSRRLSSTISA